LFQVSASISIPHNNTTSELSGSAFHIEAYNLTIYPGRLGSLLKNHKNVSYQKTIEDLQPHTIYEIKVAAENLAGIGVFTSDTIITHEDKPGSRPISVSYNNLTSTSVNITWKAPVKANGVITHYTIGIIPPNAGIEKIDSFPTFLVVDNLEKYSPYEVILINSFHFYFRFSKLHT